MIPEGVDSAAVYLAVMGGVLAAAAIDVGIAFLVRALRVGDGEDNSA